MNATCEHCRFFQSELSECRRHPPVESRRSFAPPTLASDFRFPRVANGNWCGEWKGVTVKPDPADRPE